MTVVLWASAFPGIRAALTYFDPFALALYRYLVASLVIAVPVLVLRPPLPLRRDWMRVVLLGATGFAGYNILLNWGETRTSAGAASLLISTVPIFTAFFARFLLREEVALKVLVGAAISFCGALVIAVGEGGGIRLELAAAAVLGAAGCQALYFVLQKPLLARYEPLSIVTSAMWAGTVPLLVFAPRLVAHLPDASAGALIAVFYLAVFPAVIAYFLWSYALARLDAIHVSVSLFAVPPVALVISWLWLGEVPSWMTLSGGVLSLFGVATAYRKPS